MATKTTSKAGARTHWEIGKTYVVTNDFGRFGKGMIVLLYAVSESNVASVSWHGREEDEFGELPAEYLEPETRLVDATGLRVVISNLLDKLETFNGCNEHDMSGPEQWPEFNEAYSAITSRTDEMPCSACGGDGFLGSTTDGDYRHCPVCSTGDFIQA